MYIENYFDNIGLKAIQKYIDIDDEVIYDKNFDEKSEICPYSIQFPDNKKHIQILQDFLDTN